MEQQHDDPTTAAPSPSEPSTASTPTLRFPRPQGNRHLANWISNSSPDIMSPSTTSDDANLGESSYELINSTDGESQDDRMTESVSSLEYPRTDDVESMNGSDNAYQSDSDEDVEHHSSSSIRYADQALQKPSTPPPTTDLQFRPAAQRTPPPKSIEFAESEVDPADPVFLEKISVKHTIRDFNEAETTTILRRIPTHEAPKRLVATVRQTMSLGYLSSREPLRVLYVGNPVARMDIIYKISSAICASGSSDGSGKTVNESTEGVFNIFPISDFGSSNLPDVHLLESSGRQIRVQDCTSAKKIFIEGGSFPGDTIYSLTVDKEKTYKSLFSPSGSVIQPKWETIPHIAVFFCAETDDAQTRKTRDVARDFTSRHGVPSIFITNDQHFFSPQSEHLVDTVDQHAVHLCLESGDPNRPAFSQRLPIDLASFLNIDARQMNRNLTYLTGLAESRDLAQSEQTVTLGSQHAGQAKDKPEESASEKPVSALYTAQRAVRGYVERNPHLISISSILSAAALALTLLALAVTPFLSSFRSSDPSVVSRGGTVSSATPTMATAAITTATVKVNVTTTKTVNIHNSEASASTLASALSYISDKASIALPDAEPRPATCSVELYSNNEILVRIPAGKKTVWILRGAIEIGVYRGSERVKTRLSASEDGILVQIPKEDAYGPLNVSVVTTRRPKINETFEVDLGRPLLASALDAGMRLAQGVLGGVVDTVNAAGHRLPTLSTNAQNMREDATRTAVDLWNRGAANRAAWGRLAKDVAAHAGQSWLPSRVMGLFGDVRTRVYVGVTPQDIQEEIELSIYKAQIASKLWWLKMQGRSEEHADYEQKAARFLRDKHQDLVRGRQARSKPSLGDECVRRTRKGCNSLPKNPAPEGIWRRIVTG